MEHGIGGGYYNNLPAPHPVLICLCGFETLAAGTWSQAGAELDEHLASPEIAVMLGICEE